MRRKKLTVLVFVLIVLLAAFSLNMARIMHYLREFAGSKPELFLALFLMLAGAVWGRHFYKTR